MLIDTYDTFTILFDWISTHAFEISPDAERRAA